MKQVKWWILFVLLTGCATTQSDLALMGNWQLLGYQDGVAGHEARTYQSLSLLGEADHADYQQGYLQGISEYCNPDFAYQMGLNGQYYSGVCDGSPQSQRFRMEWLRGWQAFNR